MVCGGLPAFRWFACFPLFSLPIVPNSGGDLWWFAVICGRLRWFWVVCLIVIPHRHSSKAVGPFYLVSIIWLHWLAKGSKRSHKGGKCVLEEEESMIQSIN